MTLTDDTTVAFAEDADTLAWLHDRELTRAVLAALQTLSFPENLSLLPESATARQARHLMQITVAALAIDDALIDDLAADFAAIYLTGAYGISPCESVWLSEDHLLCQDAMFQLRALYARHGLSAPDWRKRPDDHLVFQLQFIARRLATLRNDTDWWSLARFLDEHLLRWLPDFAQRTAARCAQPFYATLAMLTDSWCQQLRDLIAQHLGEERPSREEIEERLRPRCKALEGSALLPFAPSGAQPSG